MPREQINYPGANSTLIIDRFGTEIEHELDVDVPDGAQVLNDPILNVTWSVNGDIGAGHVQLSLDMDARFIKHIADGLDANGRNPVFTPALSRQEINKLIRVLRVARDKVHGRDE